MDAKIKETIMHDIVHFGLRLVLGVSFIVHGTEKFNPVFASYMPSFGIPVEMQIPIALAEFVPGILLIIGVLTRISSALLAIDMLGAIFLVKHAASLTGERGFEFDLILLAGNLAIIAIGPGRVSLSHILRKVPRFLQ